MIAKSDLIILAVSTTALAAGIYRWQQNVGAPRVATAPPPPVERVVTDEASAPGASSAPETSVIGRVSDEATAEGDRDAVRVRRLSPAEPERDVEDAGVATAPEATTRADPDADRRDDESLANADATGDAPLYGTYVVRQGDYLGRIANRFGTSVATLQSINDIDGTTILVGDELLYPLPAN